MATMKDRIKKLSIAISDKIKEITEIDIQQVLRDMSLYKIMLVPYNTPTNIEEARSNAYAVIEKKRIDYLISKQSLKRYHGDKLRLQFLHIKLSKSNLTNEEKELFNTLMYRLDFEVNVDIEANKYDDDIAAATTVDAVDAIATNASFVTVWNG